MPLIPFGHDTPSNGSELLDLSARILLGKLGDRNEAEHEDVKRIDTDGS